MNTCGEKTSELAEQLNRRAELEAARAARNSYNQANSEAQEARANEEQAASQLAEAETTVNQIQAELLSHGFANANAQEGRKTKRLLWKQLLAKGQGLDLLVKDRDDKLAALETARKNEEAAEEAVNEEAVKEAQASAAAAKEAAAAALQALSEAETDLEEKTAHTKASQNNLGTAASLSEENKRLSAEISDYIEQITRLEAAEKEFTEQMEQWNTAQAQFHETEVLCQEELDLAQDLLDRIYEIGHDGKLHGFSAGLPEEFKTCYEKADELQNLWDEADAYGREYVAPAYAEMTEKKTKLDGIQEDLDQVSTRLETLFVNLENYLKSLDTSGTTEEDKKPGSPGTDPDEPQTPGTNAEKPETPEADADSEKKDPMNGSGQNDSDTASKPAVQTLKNPNANSLPKSSAVTSAWTGFAGYTAGAAASFASLLELYRRRNRKH